jgi:hypothetical protein
VRQYGLVQTIPMVEDLSTWFFGYTTADSKARVKEGLRLWKQRQQDEIPREEGAGNVSTQRAHRDYILWVETHFGEDLPSISVEGVPPPNPDYRDFLTEFRVRHQKIQQIWLASHHSLLEKQRKLETENLGFFMRQQELEAENQRLTKRQCELEAENQPLFAALQMYEDQSSGSVGTGYSY